MSVRGQVPDLDAVVALGGEQAAVPAEAVGGELAAVRGHGEPFGARGQGPDVDTALGGQCHRRAVPAGRRVLVEVLRGPGGPSDGPDAEHAHDGVAADALQRRVVGREAVGGARIALALRGRHSQDGLGPAEAVGPADRAGRPHGAAPVEVGPVVTERQGVVRHDRGVGSLQLRGISVRPVEEADLARSRRDGRRLPVRGEHHRAGDVLRWHPEVRDRRRLQLRKGVPLERPAVARQRERDEPFVGGERGAVQ